VNKVTATVKICGREYTITGPESNEHMRKVAELVDRKMREIQRDHFGMVPNLLALMTAINIADEYIKLKEAARQVEAARPEEKKNIPLSDQRRSEEGKTIPLNKRPQEMPPGIQQLPEIGRENEEPVQRKTSRYTLFPKQSDIDNEVVAAAAGIARMAARATEEAPVDDAALNEDDTFQYEKPLVRLAEDMENEIAQESSAREAVIPKGTSGSEYDSSDFEDERPRKGPQTDEESAENEYLDQTIFDGF
jgi:cell division protein ZapA